MAEARACLHAWEGAWAFMAGAMHRFCAGRAWARRSAVLEQTARLGCGSWPMMGPVALEVGDGVREHVCASFAWSLSRRGYARSGSEAGEVTCEHAARDGKAGHEPG